MILPLSDLSIEHASTLGQRLSHYVYVQPLAQRGPDFDQYKLIKNTPGPMSVLRK